MRRDDPGDGTQAQPLAESSESIPAFGGSFVQVEHVQETLVTAESLAESGSGSSFVQHGLGDGAETQPLARSESATTGNESHGLNRWGTIFQRHGLGDGAATQPLAESGAGSSFVQAGASSVGVLC